MSDTATTWDSVHQHNPAGGVHHHGHSHDSRRLRTHHIGSMVVVSSGFRMHSLEHEPPQSMPSSNPFFTPSVHDAIARRMHTPASFVGWKKPSSHTWHARPVYPVKQEHTPCPFGMFKHLPALLHSPSGPWGHSVVAWGPVRAQESQSPGRVHGTPTKERTGARQRAVVVAAGLLRVINLA